MSQPSEEVPELGPEHQPYGLQSHSFVSSFQSWTLIKPDLLIVAGQRHYKTSRMQIMNKLRRQAEYGFGEYTCECQTQWAVALIELVKAH